MHQLMESGAGWEQSIGSVHSTTWPAGAAALKCCGGAASSLVALDGAVDAAYENEGGEVTYSA